MTNEKNEKFTKTNGILPAWAWFEEKTMQPDVIPSNPDHARQLTPGEKTWLEEKGINVEKYEEMIIGKEHNHKNCICGDCIAKVCAEASKSPEEQCVMMASQWIGPRPESFDEKWAKQLDDEAIEALKKHDPKSYAEAQAAEKAVYEEEQKIIQHLEHPFYKEANAYREDVREEQIVKGAHKYPTPFDPAEWTADELLRHAMQENVDQGHYIFGLAEKIKAMQQRCRDLEVINYDLQSELDDTMKYVKVLEESNKKIVSDDRNLYDQNKYLEQKVNDMGTQLSEKVKRVDAVEKENLELRNKLETNDKAITLVLQALWNKCQ